MTSIRSTIILALVSVAFAAPNKRQFVSQEIEGTKKDIGLQDQWALGNCETSVKSQDLVYYDHIRIQANGASTTLTDMVSWVGAKKIYCIECIGSQGTQLKLTIGGIDTTLVELSGVSAVGKDLDAIIYVYAS